MDRTTEKGCGSLLEQWETREVSPGEETQIIYEGEIGDIQFLG